MKRSLRFVGCFLVLIPQTEVVFGRKRLLEQHHVWSNYKRKRTKKSSLHQRHLRHRDQRHSFVHVDARVQDPDKVFREIRSWTDDNRKESRAQFRRSRSKKEFSARNGLRRTEEAAGGDATEEGDLGGNFVNIDLDFDDIIGSNHTDDHAGNNTLLNTTIASNQTETTDFNVTTETEYNVTIVASGSNHTNDTSTVVATQNNSTNTTQEFTFRPLRIRAFLSELDGGGEHLTADQEDHLLQSMVLPAFLSWSTALGVEPVLGNLTIDANQLVDGVSCGPGLSSGLPSVPVPDEHVQLGVPDTDLIVYLHLGFQEVKEDVTQNVTSNGTTVDTNNSSSTHGMNSMNSNANSVRNHTMAWNGSIPLPIDHLHPFDFLAATTAAATPSSPKPICKGEYLAASSFCAMDPSDRPTAALLHICIGPDFFEPSQLRTNIMTIMHELGHALGFNSISMAHFRKDDGTPWTPRDKDGQVPERLVECTGPVLQSSNVTSTSPSSTATSANNNNRTWARVRLPSSDILRFRTVRGGVRVAEVVTPSVQQVVRNHFDCQSLPGAELESGEFLPLQAGANQVPCIGDHWERRLFKSDLLNPVVDDLEFNPRFSTISLAYFADSGWYQVDLSRSSLAASWGRGAGCAFVEETCIQTTDGQVPPSYDAFFCNQAPRVDEEGFSTDIHGCTPDLSSKAACSIGQYVGELPLEYQYFNHTLGSNVGGSDPFMDYCPVYAGFSNGQCSDAQNAAIVGVNRIERFGQRNSRCLSGLPRSSRRKTALCLPIACVVEDHSLRIQIDGIYRKCSREGQVLLAHSGDQVFCPDPKRVCPTFFCRRDCLGRRNRVCNYTLGECVCQNGTQILDIPPGDNCPVNDVGVSNGTIGTPLPPSYPNNGPSTPPPPPAPVSRPVFYDPPKNDNDLPEDDSPLADYYVPTERALAESSSRPLIGNLQALLGTIAGIIAVSGVIVMFVYVRRNRNLTVALAHTDGLARDGLEEDLDEGFGEPNLPRNPNKDKMLASIVVNLRSNEYNRDVLPGQRASETDVSMTETEGSDAQQQPKLGDANDDPNLASLDDEPYQQQVVMRRRRHR